MAISPINLGSFFSNGGSSSTTSGISSGLNTQALLDSLTAVQTKQVTTLQDTITVNNSQSSALTSLKQTLTALQSAITPISSPNGLDTTNNLFAVRSSDITSNTSQAASNYLTATVASGTTTGTYTISDISQLATYANQETNEFTLASATDSVVPASPAAGFFKAGTIVVRGKNVTVSTGDSLATIAQSFNNVSSDTGISASVLQTAPGKYKLIFQSTATGQVNDFDMTNVSTTVTSDPDGVLTGLTFHKNEDGKNAEFKLNNVAITRTSNTVSDLITGVTLNLLQDTTATVGASFTLQVQPDVSSITAGINNFATAYNNFLYFYSQQTQIDSTTGAPAKTAVLYSDTTLRSIYDSVTGIASSLVKGLADGKPQTLADIGIAFTDFAGNSTVPATSNILSVDSSTLQSKLLSDFSDVANVLGDSFTSSSSKLSLYKGPTSTTINDFTIDAITSTPTPTFTLNYTDANNDPQTVTLKSTSVFGGGYSLSAPSDSIFAGMTLLYTGTGDVTGITGTVVQGLLASMNSQLNSALKTSTGLIATDQQAIVDKNTTVQKQIDTVNDKLTTLRTSLTQRFSALEAAITRANSILSLLNAQQIASQS